MKNKTILGVVVLLVVVVAGLFFMGYIDIPGKDSLTTKVTFKDKDGNLVNVPMAIVAGGQEVTTMTVAISWVIEESGIQSDTFNLYAKIYVDCKDRAGDWVSRAMKTFPYIKEMSGSRSIEWTLANILDMDLSDIGWDLKIWGYLYATATDTSGKSIDPVEKETDPITPSLTWSAGTLSIVSCGVTEAYA